MRKGWRQASGKLLQERQTEGLAAYLNLNYEYTVRYTCVVYSNLNLNSFLPAHFKY